MSKQYRCENEREYSDDPCLFAEEGRKISASEVTMPMGDGHPKCPGKTQSGKPCEHELIPLTSSSGGLPKNLPLIAGIVAALVLIAAGIITLIPDSSGSPRITATPTPLIFTKPKAGENAAMGTLRIQNQGDTELVIEQIETSPAEFSPTVTTLNIVPGGSATLFINFTSTSSDIVEGQLILHSNDVNSPTTIKLIANQDAWWVYRKLETTSKIMRAKP